MLKAKNTKPNNFLGHWALCMKVRNKIQINKKTLQLYKHFTYYQNKFAIFYIFCFINTYYLHLQQINKHT